MKGKARTQQSYEVNQYDGHEVETTTMTATEVKGLNPKGFDHYISLCLGIFGFRTKSGKWIEYRKKWPGIGKVGLAILQALQLNPGEFLTPAEIAELTDYESLRRHDVLAARVCAIRNAHKHKDERFIETRRGGGYALRWCQERTWLWVDRIPIGKNNEH
ncbi:MAG: helix-turn-helix domain-containing protein [Phycisphaerae bacterium]|nr:helix-turn-helix domain-containing protein [Phycisphaerae bacterium]